MDLTLVASDCIAVVNANRELIASALVADGAVESTSFAGRYDMRPDPLYAMLPVDSSDHLAGVKDNARKVVGTAEVVVQQYNMASELKIDLLALCARATLRTDDSDAIWPDLVSEPGRLILRNAGANVNWSHHEDAIARASSSREFGETDLDIALVCKRRNTQLRAHIGRILRQEGVEVAIRSSAHTLSASQVTNLFLDGVSIGVTDTWDTDDLVVSLCEVAAKRHMLDLATDGLRRLEALVQSDKMNVGNEVMRHRQIETTGVEIDLREVELALAYLSQKAQSELGRAFARSLQVDETVVVRVAQLVDIRHRLISRHIACVDAHVAKLEQMASHDLAELSSQVKALSTVHDAHVRVSLTQRRKAAMAQLMAMVSGVTLLVIGSRALLDFASVLVVTLGGVIAAFGTLGILRRLRRPFRDAEA